MGGSSQSGESRRYARITAGLLVMLALVGCAGLGLLPYKSDVRDGGFRSYSALETAYRAVHPGTTLASDLGKLGFDLTGARNVRVLSYLGVVEHFMPKNSIGFDHLAPEVRSCIVTRDRCTAYVFRVSSGAAHAAGSLFGLISSSQAAAVSVPEVVLLVQNGRVAYKTISGAVSGGRPG